MKRPIFIVSGILALLVTVLFVGYTSQAATPPELSHEVTPGVDREFISNSPMPYNLLNGFTTLVHGITIQVDGEDYYLSGPADGPNGENDIPGHEWRLEGSNKLLGNHYNTGPNGASKWWSSDAKDGALLYRVEAVIDQWTPDKAEYYVRRGYIHYHELVRVSDGTLHPTKVVWLKHTVVTNFTLDGGPHPELSHEVTDGIADYDVAPAPKVDREFIPNGYMPYSP